MSKLISIVSPCFNEEENVDDCYRAVKDLFEGPLKEYDYEHIFCDNCSTDRTVAKLKEITSTDRRIKLIVNSRNFGPFHNLYNGLLSTKGEGVVVTLAVDLQDPPELIVDFVRKWEEGYKVVYGVKERREEGSITAFLRRVFYRMVNRFSSFHIPQNVSEFQFADRVVVEALKKHEDSLLSG